MIAATVPALAEPLAAFVRDARVELALVLETNGRVLAQHGFTRSLDVMSACALAAAMHAAASELGRQLDGHPFGPLHTSGQARDVFLAPIAAADRSLLLLAVFDARSSLGIVRIFWSTLARALAGQTTEAANRTAADFDRDLHRSLAELFARA
jgi:predicted regulator of Ras-like GTPase activity (Roadblock/LC7/MglB family)